MLFGIFTQTLRDGECLTSLPTTASARPPFSSQLHENGDLHLPDSVAALLSFPLPVRAVNPPGKEPRSSDLSSTGCSTELHIGNLEHGASAAPLPSCARSSRAWLNSATAISAGIFGFWKPQQYPGEMRIVSGREREYLGWSRSLIPGLPAMRTYSPGLGELHNPTCKLLRPDA